MAVKTFESAMKRRIPRATTISYDLIAIGHVKVSIYKCLVRT